MERWSRRHGPWHRPPPGPIGATADSVCPRPSRDAWTGRGDPWAAGGGRRAGGGATRPQTCRCPRARLERPGLRRRVEPQEPRARGEAGDTTRVRRAATSESRAAGPRLGGHVTAPRALPHWARGAPQDGGGRADRGSSTSENKAGIHSTVVVMRLSSYGKAVTRPAWKRRRTTASPQNPSYEFVKSYSLLYSLQETNTIG